MKRPHIDIDKQTLMKVIDHLTAAIILVNNDRRVILANRMAEMISQKSKHEMAGMRGGEVLGCVHANCSPKGCGFSKKCELCAIKNNVVETFNKKGESGFFDTQMELSGAGIRDLRASTRYLSLDNIEAVLISIEDITEDRLKALLERENSQLTAAIETAGAVCHELNQPLMAISGYLQLFMMNILDKNEEKKRILQMHNEIDRMAKITRKLMMIRSYTTKEYAGVSRILDIDKSSQALGS